MSVGSKSEAGSHRSASSSSNKGRDNPSGWTKWRASQWDSLRKHVSAQRRQHIQQQHQQHAQHAQVAPHEPGDANHDTLLLHTVSSDMVALNKLSDHIKRLKKELLQLKQWEETRLANFQAGQPPPPPLPFLMNLSSSTDTPTPSDSKKGKHRRIPSTEYDPRRHHLNPPSENSESPNSSDETTKQGSVNEKIEEKKRQLKTAQDAERLRRREMARMMASTAERVKQDQRRRIQKLAEYERELGRREQERIRSRESRSDGTPTGASNKSAPSSAQNSPFHDLHGDYFSHIPTASAASTPADPTREIQFRNAWSRYAVGWARITGKLPSPANEQFTFITFPWPTLEPPKTAAGLTKDTISEFILHPPTEFHASTKTAIHEAVRRWHPDRSNAVWIQGIVAEEERALVKKGADIVIRVLNQLSADEKEIQTP